MTEPQPITADVFSWLQLHRALCRAALNESIETGDWMRGLANHIQRYIGGKTADENATVLLRPETLEWIERNFTFHWHKPPAEISEEVREAAARLREKA